MAEVTARRSRAAAWLRARPWLATWVVFIAALALGFKVDADNDAADERAEARRDRVEETRDCENTNSNRGELRRALAVVLVDNLVEAASTTPDPATVERFRAGIVDDLEREFPDEDCEEV